MKNKPALTQELYLKKLKLRYHIILFCRFFILVLFVILWEVLADLGIIDAFIFSSPIRIIKCFIDMLLSGMLAYHLGITIFETLVSFLLVIAIGLITAIIMWRFTILSKIAEPYLVTLNSLPKSALAPILIVWLGSNMKTIIVSAISVALFGTILTLFTGFIETDKEKIRLVKAFGGNRLTVLLKVVIPSNIPLIVNTLKVNLGLSLVGVIIGEFLAAKKGLGYLVIYGSQVFKMDWVIMSITLLCIISVVLYRLISLLEKKLTF